MKSIESQKQLGLEYLNKRLREDDKWYLVSAEWFKKWLSYIGLKKELTITACEPSSQPPGKISNKSILQKDPDTDYFFLKEGLLEEADYLTVPQELWQCLTENYTVESEEDIAERLVINDSPEGATELKIEVKLLRIIVEYKNETKVFHLSRLFKFAKLKSLLKISPEKPVRFFFKENCKQQLIDTTKSPCLSSSGAAMNDTILVDDEVPAAPGLTTRSSMRNQEASGGRHSAHKPGLCGLSNLGNTCFMNTSIQAMSNVPFLTDFFRKGLYKSEINLDNPLGCRGQLAEAYADLINEIWSGKNSYTVPRSFKFNLSRFAPQFTGFQQQDSQELLAFLLDGLHEDLNRIKKKPYVEMGSHVGKSDEEFAEESWQDHKKRNDSIIVDIFHGLLKSTLNCLVCNEISVKFDPFCYLSVPLPSKKEMLVQLVLVPLDQSKPLVKFKCPVMKSGNIQDLCASLEAMIEKEGFNLPKSHMVVAEVYSNKIFKIFDSNDNVSTIKERDEIYVYELPDSFYSKDYFKVVLNMKEKNVYKYSSSFCGIPILLMLPNSIPLTYGSLYQQVYQNVKRFFQPDNLDASLSDEINSKLNNSLNVNDSEHEVNMDDDDDVVTDSSQTNLRTSDRLKQKAQRSKKLFTLYVTRGDSYDYEGAPQDMSDDAAFDLTKYSQAATFNQAVCLLADFNSFSSQKGYNKKVYEQPEEHDSCSTLLTKKKECIKLSDCFNLYTKMEELSEQDYWYCSKCKAHQRSTKKFDLWSLPKVLVVHLKRFSYSRYHRDKIDSLVDFPVHDLDMSSYLIGKKTAENKYSLIAVSNHYGSLGGGHYTAYGMNRTDGKWYYFDDSCVSSSDESSVCTSAAYVLFYLRNDLYKEYIGSDAVDATVVNGDDSVNDQENMDL